MLLTAPGGASFSLTLPDEEATRRLAMDIASALEPGDLITLSGDLGAGKTTFARALIRHLSADDTIEVPSPTFTLVQNYELPRFTLVHGDLYRVASAAELAELGFEDLPDQAVVLVEWPDRAAGSLPVDRLAIAYLAEDVVPYVALAAALRRLDLSAPEILHADLDHGLIVMEDLGDEHIVGDDPPAPIEDRYAAAVDFLAALHTRNLPSRLSVTAALDYRLPRYDVGALLIEAELLLDWYLIKAGAAVSDAAHAEFVALWQAALAPVLEAPATWVLRDYHSPNLLWLPDREGIARIGLVDFQDALIGPAAYDVASLLQDARVDVPEQLEMNLLSRYVRSRLSNDRNFNTGDFTLLYATLAAQRATKILGIFARLQRRDGKPQYLRHMPRLWNYLHRSLAHPALAELKAWYAVNVPSPDGL